MNPPRLLTALALTLAVAAAPARATTYNELEPNDSKADAIIVANFTAGDRLTGFTTGSSTTVAGSTSADYFSLNFAAPDTPGIYRQQITLSAGFGGGLRGLSQTNGVIDPESDRGIQGSVGANTLNQFYTFGDATSIFYRVTGNPSTTSPYVATLSTTPVTPTVLNNAFQAGALTISCLGQTTADTDLWIYDANFRPIPGYGNDDAGGTIQSRLTANFAPGTYYVAISTYNLANDQASPASDETRTANVTDSAGVLINSGATLAIGNTSFTIVDTIGTVVAVPVTRIGVLDVNFIQFTVVPEPSTYAMMVGAGLLFLGIQRARRTA